MHARRRRAGAVLRPVDGAGADPVRGAGAPTSRYPYDEGCGADRGEAGGVYNISRWTVQCINRSSSFTLYGASLPIGAVFYSFGVYAAKLCPSPATVPGPAGRIPRPCLAPPVRPRSGALDPLGAKSHPCREKKKPRSYKLDYPF